MPKTLMLLMALLVSTAWLTAQEYPQGGSHQAGGAAASQTVQGCLHSSGGEYTLAADSGTNYQLEGDATQLKEHVGHEVRITGTPSKEGHSTGSMNPSSTKSNTASEETLKVHSLKHISKTCTGQSK